MQRFRWIALQGSSRGFLPPLLLFVFLITKSGIPALAADVSAACSSPVARVVSIQGSIELLRAHQNDWSRVTRLDTPLCEGDRLRAGALSRAALFIQPETLVRVDQNTSISVSQTAEETRVEFTQEEIVPASATAHTCGAGYFITRFPRKFKVNTPHLSAAVEGTEFLVAMRCESTELSVFEGKVLAASAGVNVFPSQSVVSGQSLTVGGGEPPAIKLQLKPADAVQWTLYYPPITPAGVVPIEDCRVVAPDGRVSCLIARAEQLLRAGRVDEARANIGDALAAAPYSSDVKALSSIISLVGNDKAEALRLAKEAVETTANSAPAWVALSYAQQADFKLEAALTSAQRATELTPSSALALARVAELQLSLGWTREAEKTAKQAVAANPSESRAHMILGFVHLAQINVNEAREDFGRAIEIDSTDPLSRLGLGLAIIREGNLVEGREQIEIAVALDPTNSLIRSYVGKAYYEERTSERGRLASSQFGLAKEFDPNDPTPWYYDAILKESNNRPVEALEDLQKSIELNDNRAVYRSRLMLDEDSAARIASLARTYSDLGFDQLALLEATKSLAADPGNYAAHRFLAEAYEKEPRSAIARESELLQSQLRQPLSLSPTSPFRTQNNPFSSLGLTSGIAKSLGPTRAAFNEFNPLFERNGLALFLDGLIGEKGTGSHQIVFSAAAEDAAVSIGQGRFHTDGFGENRDFSQEAYDAFLQVRPSAQLGFQVEIGESRTNGGDIFFPFDPANSLPARLQGTSNFARVGARYEINSQSEFLVSGIYQTFDTDLSLAGGQGRFETTGWTGEAQYSNVGDFFNYVAGAGHVGGKLVFVGADFEQQANYDNAYFYGQFHDPQRRVMLMLGGSYDSLADGSLYRAEFCPKLGVIWTPTASTTVRAAAFKSVKRPLIGDQTIEPTQIAGFNQFFDDNNGAVVSRFGLGLDQRLPKGAHVGLEIARRNILTPVDVQDFLWHENVQRAYFYWPGPVHSGSGILATWTWALTAEYQHEELNRPQEFTGNEGIVFLDTQYVPLGIAIFPGNSMSLQLRATHVSQKGQQQVDPLSNTFDVSSRFWITDLAFAYRIPGRRGRFTIGAGNLFDRQGPYVDPDPENPKFTRGRLAFARLTLEF